MNADPKVGQAWLDRDRRMDGRRVHITWVDREKDRVSYLDGGHREYSSRLSRFVRTFKPAEASE